MVAARSRDQRGDRRDRQNLGVSGFPGFDGDLRGVLAVIVFVR